MQEKRRDSWMPIPLSQSHMIPDLAHFLSLQVHRSQPPSPCHQQQELAEATLYLGWQPPAAGLQRPVSG